MLSRRAFLLAGAEAILPDASRGSEPVIAGAIRWDAWGATGTSALRSVEITLSPREYEDRAPFCATMSSKEELRFAACKTQAVIDAEIAYAAGAGLNFWAYCWYGATDPMMNEWALHQASKRRNDVNWCLLLQFSRMGGAAAFNAQVPSYVRFFQQVNYQKLLRGRPLIYIYLDDTHLASDWHGDWANVRGALDVLRDASLQAGLEAPYVVVMEGWPTAAQSVMRKIGADAISNYMARVPPGEPAPYEALDSSARAYWASMAATGAPIVPICMTGWDTRPRKLHPPPWQKNQRPGAGMKSYVVGGTPMQIAAHVQAAVTYINMHPASCPSHSLLIYSWNECDEGGSALVPTYTPGGPNHAILDAVGAVLRKG